MRNRRFPDPCPDHAEACAAAAWGEPEPEWAAHAETCPRCREAYASMAQWARAVARSRPPVPEHAREGLVEEVLGRTTRRRAPARRAVFAWAGGALAAAAAAFLALRRPSPPDLAGGIDLTEVDLELLDNLDLAENLPILEVLDALEALDDA